MKKILITICVIVLLISAFFAYSYFMMQHKNSVLLNPFVDDESGNEIASTASDSSELVSDFPIDCVLSYGTYTISQQGCDELNVIDANPDPQAEMISCQLAEGTFLFTQKECDILKTSQGSRDVMKTLD